MRNIYGATEIGLLTLHQGSAYDLETVGSWLPVHPRLGTPIEYRVSDEGELQVRGGVGFSGYYKNPEATAKKTVDGWYRTEDAVHLTDGGELVYLERIEDMRQLADGHRYPPQFIENRLRFSPFIKDAMTLGDTDKPFVAAFINIDSSTLGRWAEQRGIGYTSFTDLSQNPEIRELIRRETARRQRVAAGGFARAPLRQPAQGTRPRRGRADPFAQDPPQAPRAEVRVVHRRDLLGRARVQRRGPDQVPGRAHRHALRYGARQ